MSAVHSYLEQSTRAVFSHAEALGPHCDEGAPLAGAVPDANPVNLCGVLYGTRVAPFLSAAETTR